MKIKILREGAKVPLKATKGAAGYDLYLPEDVYIKPGRNVVKLGLAMEIPLGFVGKVESRSGLASRGMLDANGLVHDADVISGKIDSDYRGEIGVIINNHEESTFRLIKDLRIAQMIFYPVGTTDFELADELSDTDRTGGFGSTGR